MTEQLYHEFISLHIHTIFDFISPVMLAAFANYNFVIFICCKFHLFCVKTPINGLGNPGLT